MKKVILIALLSFGALFAKAQNTVTLESGTSPLNTYQLRYKAVTPDSLNHLWIYNGITLKYNQVYTATEANQRFAPAGSGVTSVLGTTNRVTVSPTSGIPVINISATFEALLEKVANKATSYATVNNTLYPTIQLMRDSTLHPNKNLYDIANKTTARANLGLVIGTDVLAYRTFGTAANNNTSDFEVPLTFTYGLNRTGTTIKADSTVLKSKSAALADYNILMAGKQGLITSGPVSVTAGVSALGKNIALNGGSANAWNANKNSIDIDASAGSAIYSRSTTSNYGIAIIANGYSNGTGFVMTRKNNGNVGELFINNGNLQFSTLSYGVAGSGTGTVTNAFIVDSLGNQINTGTITASIGAGSANNFVTTNGGKLEYRTAAQVLSDIGVQTAGDARYGRTGANNTWTFSQTYSNSSIQHNYTIYTGVGSGSISVGNSAYAGSTDYTQTLQPANGTVALIETSAQISSGTTAPASTPTKVGDIYVNTSAKTLYYATGSSTSADWTGPVVTSGSNATFGTVSATHLIGNSSIPTIAAGAGLGTSPTLSILAGSTDVAGQFSITPGTSPTAGGVVVTITFATPYATAPFAGQPSAVNNNATPYLRQLWLTTTTTTLTITLASGISLIAGTTYIFNYSLIQ